ncbi:hypothetical protein SLA2020_002530 [Shorea laevis]
MAEKEKSSLRKPLSLNDSHYRLLQDLSAAPKPKEEEMPQKTKLPGRRRLCKASSKGNADDGDDGVPRFSGITDFDDSPSGTLFDSPPPTKSSREGGNEIRDILNDLSSRLEFLSIEKVPKKNDQIDESLVLTETGVKIRNKKVDSPGYACAGSLFSLMSNQSDSSLDGAKNGGSGVYVFSESRDEEFVDSVLKLDEISSLGLKQKGSKLVDGELASGVASGTEEGGDDNDDLQGEQRDNAFLGRVCDVEKNNQRVNKGEHVQQSFVSRVRKEEEDGSRDDCVVLSFKKSVKAVRHGNGLKYGSSTAEVLDDYTDESILEDEGSINLRGPKASYKLQGKIAKMLYPHQREGLKWLWSLHCQDKGGILGDDMGLGKTMQICSFLAGLFHSRLIKRALVVAPKTLLPHWIKELSTVGLSEKTREYYGTSTKARQYELQYVLQDKGILLTTYDIVRNNSKALQGANCYIDDDSEDGVTWDYMILDEGHLIKNPSTQRAKSLFEIPSVHRIVISGTPIQNNLKELWALFNFCCPELLGDNKWFKDKYENPVLRGNDKNASDREKRVGSTVAKELRECIQPYFLRRLKKEVFCEDDATTSRLSKKNEIIVWLRLTSCQRRLYEAFLNSEIVLSAFDGSPLAALTILKKICDHPLLLTKRAAEDVLEGMDSMLNPEDVTVAEKLAKHVADVAETDDFQEYHDNISCKISFILSLLETIVPEGHHVLIFSQTRKMLNLIEESLVCNGYQFLRIDGTTKASDRVKIVNDFQEGVGAPIFLLTSLVGGLGLTLTRADRVIVVDPAWNPSTDNQSVDRAYRIGQKKDVLVYRLMTCGTVEEKIYRKQVFKGGLFKTATEHKEQIRYFSQQDLRELFSLPKQGFDISLTQQQLHEEHDGQHKMDESLEAHIKFLETLGIGGVSNHGLLFSKAAPVPVAQEEDEDTKRKGTTIVGNPSSSSSTEHKVDGSEHAFNPKDMKLKKKTASPDTASKLTESEIKERIIRLSQIFANKVTISKLPDKGAKLEKQMAELNAELQKIRMEERREKEVINLDDITGELRRRLNV